MFEEALERIRRNYRLRIYGYVVMSEHVHLLVSEPERAMLADALKSLKQGVSRRLLAKQTVTSQARPQTAKPQTAKPQTATAQNAKPENVEGGPLKPEVGLSGAAAAAAQHFWQKRYYDFNIRNHDQFVEKLRYIHRNPVKAGLCRRPEDWPWSSFNHYATGAEGRVEIESDWTARKRERAEGKLCPAVELPHSS